MDFRLELILNFNISVSIRLSHIRALMREHGFIFMGKGRHRETYRSPNGRYVLKFPLSRDGLNVNRSEHEIWHDRKSQAENDGTVYAPCRIIKNTILMMWAVKSSYGNSYGDENAYDNSRLEKLEEGHAPEWVDNIDCLQAGFLNNGKLVAYDYGNY